MSNFHLRDKTVTYKAKGLLSFMLSLPENWDYSLAGLTSVSKESKDGIRSILKELQINHYLEVEKIRGSKGYFEYNYLIYENPHFVDNDIDIINPYMEKQTQISTKEQKDKDDKHISSFFVAEEHNILTLELIKKGYINEEDTQFFYYDGLFQNLLEEENSYKDLIIITNHIIKKVLDRDYKDENENLMNIKILNNQINKRVCYKKTLNYK